MTFDWFRSVNLSPTSSQRTRSLLVPYSSVSNLLLGSTTGRRPEELTILPLILMKPPVPFPLTTRLYTHTIYLYSKLYNCYEVNRSFRFRNRLRQDHFGILGFPQRWKAMEGVSFTSSSSLQVSSKELIKILLLVCSVSEPSTLRTHKKSIFRFGGFL